MTYVFWTPLCDPSLSGNSVCSSGWAWHSRDFSRIKCEISFCKLLKSCTGTLPIRHSLMSWFFSIWNLEALNLWHWRILGYNAKNCFYKLQNHYLDTYDTYPLALGDEFWSTVLSLVEAHVADAELLSCFAFNFLKLYLPLLPPVLWKEMRLRKGW